MENQEQLLLLLQGILFISVILMNVVRRNSRIIPFYGLQSLALVGLLLVPALQHISVIFMLVIGLTLIIKVIIAPYFFFKFIDDQELTQSVNTYMSLPMTLGMVLLLTFLSRSDVFTPFFNLAHLMGGTLYLSIATILLSLFMMINRKGVLSQIIGILSMENGVVAFGAVIGFEQIPVLELGIVFDILLWIVISTTFITLIYTHFGTLDNTVMKQLKEQ